MKLAHIVPVSFLDTIPQEQTTHLVLSELILSSEPYFQFYARRKLAGDTIILDNPVHEDRPIELNNWLAAIRKIEPTVAVIPDTIDSSEMTLKIAEAAVGAIVEASLPVELMAVPHGRSNYDWVVCARSLARLPQVRWLGLSLERRLNDDALALSRRRERIALTLGYAELSRLNLHLLGLSESAKELGKDPIWQRAVSVDCSKFAVWYLYGTPVRPPVIPIDKPYPGRTPFGGSYEYFTWVPPEIPVSLTRFRNRMRDNLRDWNNFAERKQGLCP